VCPRCRAPDVRTGQSKIHWRPPSDRGVYVDTSGWLVSPVATTDFVCVRCGYFEQYIAEEGTLRKVAEEWDRVAAPPA
jgi:hypothetical protein